MFACTYALHITLLWAIDLKILLLTCSILYQHLARCTKNGFDLLHSHILGSASGFRSSGVSEPIGNVWPLLKKETDNMLHSNFTKINLTRISANNRLQMLSPFWILHIDIVLSLDSQLQVILMDLRNNNTQ